MGGVIFKDLEKYKEHLERTQKSGELENALKSTINELGGRLMRGAVLLTPVAKINGGTLKRGWRCGAVKKEGRVFTLDVFNNTEYAMYVEFGHRTRKRTDGTRGFVPGRFMLERASRDVDKIKDHVVKSKIEKLLRGGFK